jgi:glycosyltransferase involved in cell wall biosynthesis
MKTSILDEYLKIHRGHNLRELQFSYNDEGNQEGDATNIRLLMIGIMPPPEGGVRVSFHQLVNNLRKCSLIDLSLIDLTARKIFIVRLPIYLYRMLKAFYIASQVDVISFHATNTYLKYFGPLIFMMSKIWSKPIVLRRFGGDCDLYFKNQNKLAQWIQKKTILNSDISFYQTYYLVEFFRKKIEKPIKWFPTNRLEPDLDKKDFNKAASKFVFLGSIVEAKGIKELIEAFKSIDCNVSLDIYGVDGIFVDRLIENHPKIRYRGSIKNSDVYKTLLRYDALILPTYFKGEGYPGVIIEAFSLGLPVIATNLRSIKEIVEDRKNGLLIEPKKVKDIQKSVALLHFDSYLYKSIVKRNLKEKYKFSSKVWTDYFVKELLNTVKDLKKP